MIELIAMVAVVMSAASLVIARRAHARRVAEDSSQTPIHTPALENHADHAPDAGVCRGSLADTPIHTPEPAIVAGVRPDGGGTTIEHDAPALGWRAEVLELIAAYESTADPPSRVWSWSGRPVVIKPVKGGIRLEARGDCYLVITQSHAVMILQAQAVDLHGTARAWGELWGPRVHALLFGSAVTLETMAAAGWRGTSLHLAMELARVQWPPVEYLHSREAWSGRGMSKENRLPEIQTDGAGNLARLEIGDPTSAPTFARAYEKTAEQEARRTKTGAETVRVRWRSAGWMPGEPVYRLEGGLRGKALRLAGLDLTDPAVLLSDAAHVQAWAYLFGHPERRGMPGLIRLLDPTDTARPKDRRVHPIWRAVQQGAARAAALSLVQIRDATEAEDDARRRRATSHVRRGLATLAAADGQAEPRAAAEHAVTTTRQITSGDAWPDEIALASANYASIHEARERSVSRETDERTHTRGPQS